MQDKPLSEIESLNIITQMIQVAKEEHHEKGDGWLIWGWLLFIASLLSAILSLLGTYSFIPWVWNVMLVIGLGVGIWSYFANRGKNKASRTYVEELLEKLGTGFFLSLFAMIIANSLSKANFAFGYFYILYGFWMYIHGSVLRFRPLITGAMVNWAAAIAIFLIDNFMYDMIVSTIAILIGYLIPGYMLRAEHKKKLNIKRNQTDGF